MPPLYTEARRRGTDLEGEFRDVDAIIHAPRKDRGNYHRSGDPRGAGVLVFRNSTSAGAESDSADRLRAGPSLANTYAERIRRSCGGRCQRSGPPRGYPPAVDRDRNQLRRGLSKRSGGLVAADGGLACPAAAGLHQPFVDEDQPCLPFTGRSPGPDRRVYGEHCPAQDAPPRPADARELSRRPADSSYGYPRRGAETL